MEGPPTEATPFNVPQHVLPWSPLALIGEHSPFTGFSLPSLSTPYEPLTREPPPRYLTSSRAKGVPSTFMEPLSRIIHLQLEMPCTPSRLQGPSTFREPYPVANPPMAPTTFVHSPDPQPVSGDSPLVAMTCRFTQVEEYLRTAQLTTSTLRNTPSAPHHLFLAAPQQRLTYTPVWPAAQSGPPPPMPPTQPAPSAPFPMPPAPVAPLFSPPAAPPQNVGYAPGGWGPMPNYYPAPAQPYPIGYPPGPWPPYQQNYTGPYGHGDEDSETIKPDKFTGRDPSKLRPFVVSCIMAFDSWPHKFATDRQRVSYAVSYLSDITMLWWQPILVAFPELSIRNNWGEFVNQLNTYFGQPDLAQASECALCALKMQDYQHVNKYMIEFSKHATHTEWNDASLYGEFYQGLAECIKDQLLSLDFSQMIQQLKADALKCDTYYWECQGENAAPSGWARQSTFTAAPEKLGNNLSASTDAPKTGQTNAGIGVDGNLTEAEHE